MRPLNSSKRNKLLLSLCLICLPFFCSAQKDSSTKKISFGLFCAPEIVFNSIQNSVYQKQEAKPAFGMALGITGERFISNKFALRGSLGYSIKKSRLLLNGLVLESDIDPISGKQISESKIKTTFIAGEIYLQLLGVITSKNKKVFATGGLEILNIFKNTSNEVLIRGNGSKSYTEGVYNSNFNFAPCISVGYNIISKNRKILSIEPQFKTYLKSYGDQLHSTFKVNTFGLRTSFWF